MKTRGVKIYTFLLRVYLESIERVPVRRSFTVSVLRLRSSVRGTGTNMVHRLDGEKDRPPSVHYLLLVKDSDLRSVLKRRS